MLVPVTINAEISSLQVLDHQNSSFQMTASLYKCCNKITLSDLILVLFKPKFGSVQNVVDLRLYETIVLFLLENCLLVL